MGWRFSKSPARREETYHLLAELRSLLIASWPPSALILEESRHHPISLAIAAGTLKEAISKNPGLLSLLNDYLNHAIIPTLGFLTDVKSHLDKACIILSAIHTALEFFEEENAQRSVKKKKNKKKKCTKKYSKAVDKLKELRTLGDPFVGLNIDELRSACEQQRSLLRQRNHELERSLKSVKKWRKAWNVIYMAGVVAVLACSVMLAAVVSPAAAVAGATASATAMKCVEPYINSLWEEWERSLQGGKDIIEAMQRKDGLAMHRLENIRLIVEKLEIDTVMLKTVDFAISKEDDGEIEVKIGIENIKAKKEEFEKIIDSLKESMDSSDGEIRKAITEFLEIIMDT